jgi:DNA-binding winged helix-turn-helix (wHTH) protein/alpha-beta hydrolase superfamily lysophospholipase
MSRPEQHARYRFGTYWLAPGRRELLDSGGKIVTLTPKAFDVLSYLVQRPGQLVTKRSLMEAIWPNQVVEENTLAQAISTVRHALQDNAREPRYVATVPGKGFQFVAEVDAHHAGVARDTASAPDREMEHQTIRFCPTPDGVRLAYAIAGEGSPIVRTAHWLSHVEYDWRCPVYHHLLRDLSTGHRLIRYDHRGNGLSDWDVPELSLEAFVSDLESVVDVSGVQRFALLGSSMGVPVAITFAARHPDRVSHLILHGGTASPLHTDEDIEAFAHVLRTGWGESNPAVRQMLTTLLMPDCTLEEQHALNELQRLSASPENAARTLFAICRMDVAALLVRIRVPTLVCHAREDGTVPVDAGRRIAASIPGARFVLLESRNHILLEHDPSTARFKRELLAFIA